VMYGGPPELIIGFLREPVDSRLEKRPTTSEMLTWSEHDGRPRPFDQHWRAGR